MGKQWKQWQTILGVKMTENGECSHEIKRRLLLGRKTVTNLDSILKSRGITLPTKIHLVRAMVFPAVMYGCESWTVKKAEHLRIYAFELWCWRRHLRVPWTSRRSSQYILNEISPEYSLEGLMLKLKLQYFGYLMWRINSFEKPCCWERLKAGWEGDDRGWDGWIASPIQLTWVWVNSRSWWWTGRPGVLQSMGSQSRTQLSDWTELNWVTPRFDGHPWIKDIQTHIKTSAHFSWPRWYIQMFIFKLSNGVKGWIHPKTELNFISQPPSPSPLCPGICILGLEPVSTLWPALRTQVSATILSSCSQPTPNQADTFQFYLLNDFHIFFFSLSPFLGGKSLLVTTIFFSPGFSPIKSYYYHFHHFKIEIWSFCSSASSL